MTDGFKPDRGFSNDLSCSFSFLFFFFVLAIAYLHDFLPHEILPLPLPALSGHFSQLSLSILCLITIIACHVTLCVVLTLTLEKYDVCICETSMRRGVQTIYVFVCPSVLLASVASFIGVFVDS